MQKWYELWFQKTLYRSKSYLKILKTTEYQLNNDVTVTSLYFVKKILFIMWKKSLLYEFSHG